MTIHHLTVGDRQLITETTSGVPEIIWFGAPFTHDLAELHKTGLRPIAKAQLSAMPAASILPTEADGWVGEPGIEGLRADGSTWSPRFVVDSVDEAEQHVVITSTDTQAGLRIVSDIAITPSGVATISVQIHNDGDTDYLLTACRLTVPVGDAITEVQVSEGRWVHEFQEVRLPWRAGAIEQTNRRGRTSHDKSPWIMAGTAGFSNRHGTVWGAHLGWSGNSSVRAEVLTDGRRVLQLGETLLAGEVRLAPGEHYDSPTLYLAMSSSGMNGVSQSFHEFVRSRPQHEQITSARPVHMNTWEAVYFNHDLEVLKDLADRACEVGAERYVLDDGWFHGRRNDDAGLGDWWVDDSVWPNGLSPLIEHVRGLGMEMGIWVEPEMVNPDSDLYRAHPDWVLSVPGYAPVLGRDQLLLDLTNADAFGYILDHLDRLLTNHDVQYVKWDMNRDHTQPASGVRAASHDQTLAVYRLIDTLRERHPGVDIESCSSGGARADLGILERTDRVWTSDSNDALARQRIQRGFLRWFPPELMGAHVGSGTSHTSGRRHTLGFRGTTAMFGHFGIEWNLSAATEEDRARLTRVVALHKAHRSLFHSGTMWQLDCVDPGLVALGVVSADKREAMYSVAQLEMARYGTPERLALLGLDPQRSYSVELVAVADSSLGLATRQPEWTTTGIDAVTGDVLERFGLQLPALDPESAILIRLAATA